MAEVMTSGKRAGKRGIARELKKNRRRFNVALSCFLLVGVSLVAVGYLLSTETDLLPRISVNADRHQWAESVPIAAGGHSNDAVTEQTLDSETSFNQLPEILKRSDAATSPEPTELVSPQQASPPPTVQDLRELGQLLVKARIALSERRIDKARGLLALAAPLARRPQDVAKHRRLAALTGYVEGYWAAARDGLRQVRAGDELAIQDTRVMVVEKNEETIILRMSGQNKSYAINNLPLELKQYFADRWFDSSAASTKVFRGAMMAVSPGFEKGEVLQLWRHAQQTGGVDLGDLELVLEDTYDLAP